MASTIERSQRNETPTAGKAESILAAAKRMFLESGFGAVSMDAIAREAGVSKATVYAHFAGKEELFGAVIGRECEHYLAGFSAGELDPADARASLTSLGRRFLDLLLSPDAIALHRLILGEVSRFPELGQVFWQAGPERNLTQIETFLRAAAAAGVARNRRSAARRRAVRRFGARGDPVAPSAPPRNRCQRGRNPRDCKLSRHYFFARL